MALACFSLRISSLLLPSRHSPEIAAPRFLRAASLGGTMPLACEKT